MEMHGTSWRFQQELHLATTLISQLPQGSRMPIMVMELLPARLYGQVILLFMLSLQVVMAATSTCCMQAPIRWVLQVKRIMFFGLQTAGMAMLFDTIFKTITGPEMMIIQMELYAGIQKSHLRKMVSYPAILFLMNQNNGYMSLITEMTA